MNSGLGANRSPSDPSPLPPHQLPILVEKLAKENWEDAASLIEQHWDDLAATHPGHLLDAIGALPGAALIERPTLMVAANYLQHVVNGSSPGRFDDDGWVNTSQTGLGVSLIDTLTLSTAKSAGARTTGDMPGARRSAEEARAALDSAPAPERAAIKSSLPHLRLQWGRSLELADAPGSALEYEEAYETAILTKQTAVARRAAAHHAWMDAERGRLNSAEQWVSRAHDTNATNTRYDAVISLTASLLRLDRGDRVGATRELGRSNGFGDGEYWAAALWVQSMIANDSASAALVDSRLAHQLTRHPDSLSNTGANGRYIRAAGARLSGFRGRPAGISAVDPGLSSTDKAAAGVFAHARGNYHEALNIVRMIVEPEEHPRTQSIALLVTAAAAVNLGQNETAAAAFAQAHALLNHERLYTPYECIPWPDLEHLTAITGLELPNVESPFRLKKNHFAILSKRELEILRLLAQGKTPTETAQILFVAPNTVKSTTRRLYRKLDVNSRSSAIDRARQSGLL